MIRTSLLAAACAVAVFGAAAQVRVGVTVSSSGPAFRAALRDALEQIDNLTTSTGVVNMSPTDHVGFDQRSPVMVQIHDGGWRLARWARYARA
jgi:hypothetical protein